MKQHLVAIIFSIIVGLIIGLPHILIPGIITPEKYDPLQFNSDGGSSITMEEVYTYVPEVREILEGKFWVTDTQVAEYNGQQTPFIGETGLAEIMAGLAKLTGSIQNAFIAADFIFPATTFLLVYSIVWLFTKNQVVSATAGTVLIIWPELSVLFPYPNALISAAKAAFDPRDFLFISRNFHPQLSLPAYLGAFLLVLLALERRKLWLSVLAGAAVGFLFYTYIFNWTAFGLGMIIFLMYKVAALVVKRSDLAAARSDLMKFLAIVIVAGLVAVPYFLQTWQFRQSGLAADFFTKLSLPKRGFFDLVARQWIFILVFTVINFKKVISSLSRDPAKGRTLPPKAECYVPKRSVSPRRGIGARFLDFGTHRLVHPFARNDKDHSILFLCFWIAPLILPDLMQNILGRDLEGKHWVRRIAYPWSVMGLSIAAWQIVNKKWLKLACFSLILLVLSYGLIRQTEMSYKISNAYALNPDKQELYDWINKNTPSGSVIASLGWDTVVNIPAKTHAFNFSPIGMRTIAPTDETIDRFLWTAALYEADNEYVERAFSARGEGTTRALYFKFAEDNEVFAVPPELTQDIKQRYQKIVAQSSNGSLPPFRLDYILVGPEERQSFKLSAEKINLKPVFSNSDYLIYSASWL